MYQINSKVTEQLRNQRDSKWVHHLKNKKQEEKNNMEFVAVTCQNCGSKMHVLSKSVRKEMYCTINCLESGISSKI
jgi:ribosomal protein S27E